METSIAPIHLAMLMTVEPGVHPGPQLILVAGAGPQAPGRASAPTPPQVQGCPCDPGSVSPASGALSISQTDLELVGIGPSLSLTRRYSSERATEEGPFGYGWNFDLNQRLQMYVHFHITEHRGDGSRTTFQFTDGTNGAFVQSFDSDSNIHTDLSKGSYTPNGAPGWSLTREAADRYVVTRADGSQYIYKGYHASPMRPRAN